MGSQPTFGDLCVGSSDSGKGQSDQDKPSSLHAVSQVTKPPEGKSRPCTTNGLVAQLVEHWVEDPGVGGSSPSWSTKRECSSIG